MIKREKFGLQYYQFESLITPGFFQAVFTRVGGYSPEPWSSLNLGGTVGDSGERVKKNLSKLLSAIDGSTDDLVQIRQIHSNDVIHADQTMDGIYHGDAIITNKPGLILLMRFADCVPIVFYDPILKAAGIAHAGWKGTAQEISLETVRKMEEKFGSKPSDLIVGIGPSIGPDHYLVGEEVIFEIKQNFPLKWNQILVNTPDGVKLDLWKANQVSLQKAGVKSVEISNICTGCHTDEWFSHRAENGRTGRFAAVIIIK
jgi:YfiH family protein